MSGFRRRGRLFVLSGKRRRTAQYDRERKCNARRILSHYETPPVSFSARRNSVPQQAAENVESFVGRAFRHDKKTPSFSGVLTPEIPIDALSRNPLKTEQPCRISPENMFAIFYRQLHLLDKLVRLSNVHRRVVIRANDNAVRADEVNEKAHGFRVERE